MATWELVCHGEKDPSDEELKSIAKKIADGYNIGDYDDQYEESED